MQGPLALFGTPHVSIHGTWRAACWSVAILVVQICGRGATVVVVTAKLGVREGKRRRGDLLGCVLSFLLTGGLVFGLLGHRCYIAGSVAREECSRAFAHPHV